MSSPTASNPDIIKIANASYWIGEKSSRSMKFHSSTSNMDKALKAANFIPSFVAQILEADGVSPQAVEGLRSLSADARLVRNGVGLWNAAQSIPKVIYRYYELNAALMTLREKDKATWKVDRDADGVMYYKRVKSELMVSKEEVSDSKGVRTFKRVAVKKNEVTTHEKVLGVASSCFKLLEWIAFNICFIVCAPAQWLDRWFNLGPHAKTVGGQFTLFFLIKDCFLFAGYTTDMARKKCELDRTNPLTDEIKETLMLTLKPPKDPLQMASYRLKQNDLKLYIQAQNEWREKQYEAVFTTIKSVCDIALGVFNTARIKVNQWVTLTLGLLSACVGLWEIYRDTPPGKADKKEQMPEAFKLDASGLKKKVLSMQKHLPKAPPAA